MRFVKDEKYAVKGKYSLFTLFLIIYLSLWLYSFKQGLEWIIDNSIAIITLTLIFFMSEKLKLNKVGFFLVNLALLSHNLGTFGFYGLSYGVFQYDNVVHLFSSVVVCYTIFNLFVEKFHFGIMSSFKKNKFLLTFFIISASITLGVIIEIMEFTGDTFLGTGEGLFFRGTGDSDPTNYGVESQYKDTMQDLIVNTIGSIIGAIGYYFIKKTKGEII